MGEKHKEALAMLKYGVLARKGFLLLTGDVGTGKTTLVNALLESLKENTLVINITDPLLEPMEFFHFIAASLDLGERFSSKVDFILRLGEFLKQANADGKNVLLILDEAHRLSKDLLEQFRLLSNIELPEKKLINIFLVGQEEFNRTLMSSDCRALRQRITLTYNIQPLSEEETSEYIRYRLRVAGTETEIFNRKAVGEVYRFSQGYPRLINIICDHALLTGFVRESRKITPRIIQECSQELCLLGDSIRISSSDFFEGKSPSPPSRSPESPPAQGTGHAMNAQGTATPRFLAGPPQMRTQQGTTDAPASNRQTSSESAEGVAVAKEHRARLWVMAGFVTLLLLASALLLQRDLPLHTALTDPAASAASVPAQGLLKRSPSTPVPEGPDTIALQSSKPVTEVKEEGPSTPASPSPYEQAQEQINKGNIERAIAFLEDAMAGNPHDLPRLRALYAETLHRKAGRLADQDTTGAEFLLAQAVEADPTHGEAYFALGKIYTKSKRYPEAIRAYRKAAELNDRSADTLFNLGFVYAATGEYGLAEQTFLRVTELRPPYLDKALFNLAAVQRKQGKTNQCIRSLEEALAVNPNNERARTYLRRIRQAP
jgi:type II secretory pathway predicted ATPase ExeA/tetratricopeptide (TPR) repeat protein